MIDRTEQDALAIARAAFQAVEARDWRRLRELVDPAALNTIKQQAIAVTENTIAPRASSPEEIEATQPGIPRVVAEWFSDQEARALASEEPAGITSLGVGSIDELRSLSAGDVFVRWMAATDLSERLRRATGEPHSIRPVRYVVLGIVMEGDTTAHAVYRAEGLMHGALVESLRWTESGWRLSAEGVISRATRTHFRIAPR